MVAVVHHLVDIALEVRESGSEYLQLGIESLPAADRMAIEGNIRILNSKSGGSHGQKRIVSAPLHRSCVSI